MYPLISVIVPIYNSSQYLSDCIESILNQTYRNLELILVNDGSTDNSLEICNFYKKKDCRVIVVNKINEGVSIARNIGIKYSKGEYITFVDSDDMIDLHTYQLLIDKIKKYSVPICVLGNYTINQHNLKKKVITSNEAIKELMLLRFPTSLWAYIYSKEVIKDITLNEKIHFFEDFEFNFKILLNKYEIAICYENLYYYRDNNMSINHQTINDKKITALTIIDEINNQKMKEKLLIKKYSIYFEAHIIISLIRNLTKFPNVEDYFYEKIKQGIKNNKKAIFISKYVFLKYKLTIFAFMFFPKLFCKSVYYLERILGYIKNEYK